MKAIILVAGETLGAWKDNPFWRPRVEEQPIDKYEVKRTDRQDNNSGVQEHRKEARPTLLLKSVG